MIKNLRVEKSLYCQALSKDAKLESRKISIVSGIFKNIQNSIVKSPNFFKFIINSVFHITRKFCKNIYQVKNLVSCNSISL